MTCVRGGTSGIQYPKIVGHEGAGYVEKVGPLVTSAKPGDPVLLSFSHCGACDFCKTGRPAYCIHYADNVAGPTDVFEDVAGPEQGQFFGQSSFSSLSIVKEASIINVKGLVKDDEDLKLFAPLSCGIQTGAGAVTILGQAGPTDIVVVTGLSCVGLTSIMAAKVAGCKMIIGVDKLASRLDLATSLGATHVLNTTSLHKDTDLTSSILALANHDPVSIVIETTTNPAIMTAGIKCLGRCGKYVQVGVPPADWDVAIHMTDFFANSNMLLSCKMGDAVPRDYIPEMIRWYREGVFPIEKLVTMMPVRDFARAQVGVETGNIIKPVLVW